MAFGLSCSAACGIFPDQRSGNSLSRGTHVPCTGRRILNHCATREALGLSLFLFSILSPVPAHNRHQRFLEEEVIAMVAYLLCWVVNGNQDTWWDELGSPIRDKSRAAGCILVRDDPRFHFNFNVSSILYA